MLTNGKGWDTKSIVFSNNSCVAGTNAPGAATNKAVPFHSVYSQVGNGKRPLIVAFTCD